MSDKELDLVFAEKIANNNFQQVRRDMLADARKNLLANPDTQSKNLHIQRIIEEIQEDRLLSINEVADLLGVSQQTLRNWELRGKLKPERTEGKHRRYRESDVNKLRKKCMGAEQILISSTTPVQMEGLFHSLFGRFDPLEKISVSLSNDPLRDGIRITIEAEDGSNTVSKFFEIGAFNG